METTDSKHFHIADALIGDELKLHALVIDINGILPGGKTHIALDKISSITKKQKK